MISIPSTQVQAERYRRNLSLFMRGSWGVIEPNNPYLHNWHVDCISEYLTAVTLGEIRRLLINICPRIGKSRQITTAWPVWEWIDHPEYRYLFSSYSGDLARDHSRERRLIIESDWFQERWGDRFRLKGDQNVVTYFANDKGGRMQSRGTGGMGTGKGGNRIIIDDPHNVKQAESQVQRQQAIRDFDKNLSTRLDNPTTGAIVCVMQRLHYDDLSGHLIDQIGGYEHLKLQTLAEMPTTVVFPRSGDVVEREKGDILFPTRQDETYLKEQKRALGTSGFAAQHQQDPLPEGGDRIHMSWFPRYKFKKAKSDNCIQSWDTGLKPNKTAAYSVCMTFELYDGQWYITDVFRKQMGYPELRRMCVSLYGQFKPTAVLIENKASGISLIQDLKAGHREVPAIPIEPEADKITRMETQSPHLEAGQIALPVEAPWLSEFEAEVMRFPDPLTWDQIDTLSQFLKYQYGRKRKIVQRKLKGL